MSLKTKKLLTIIIALLFSILLLFLLIRLKSSYEAYSYEKNITPTPLQKMYSVDKNVSVTYTIAPNTTPEPTPVLIRSGNGGEHVKQIQLRLMELGFYNGEIDGQFGPSTKNSVIWFQTQHGLDADGIIGSSTYNVLFGKEAQKAVPTPSPSPTISPIEKAKENSENFLLLVNKHIKLGKDYTPSNLINVEDILDKEYAKVKYKDTKADYTATLALNEMLKDACNNYNLKNWQIGSAYRSYSSQNKLFEKRVNEFIKSNNLSRDKAKSATNLTVALPGTSEHQTGLAFDISVPGKLFKDTEQSKWIAEHCYEFGFILRYTKDKEKITGYIAEPWHIRYVGIEHSQIMHKENLALEEYIKKYGEK